ncbi:MAG: hypothetical protein M5U19_12775 [Microthrixaceae bacterium]|nr:hypothetical protein [Microthrixaceae bacterium]
MTPTTHPCWVRALLGCLLVLPACGTDGAGTRATTTNAEVAEGAAPVVDPGDGGDYAPSLDPADFVAGIDNPYLPFTPGSTWTYLGDSDGRTERVEVEVLSETRDIGGIEATVVRDTVYVDGEMVEDTYDWFAQDRDGSVWYLGEDTHEYEDGVAVNANGAWEHGVDGAVAGMVMPAAPTVGDSYRQEYYEGEAEDMAEVLEVGVARSIEAGEYHDVVVTEDWTPLEPEVVEQKWYARGVGNIYSTHTRGKAGTVELVAFVPAQ